MYITYTASCTRHTLCQTVGPVGRLHYMHRGGGGGTSPMGAPLSLALFAWLMRKMKTVTKEIGHSSRATTECGENRKKKLHRIVDVTADAVADSSTSSATITTADGSCTRNYNAKHTLSAHFFFFLLLSFISSSSSTPCHTFQVFHLNASCCLRWDRNVANCSRIS